jgi:hypothetical protein
MRISIDFIHHETQEKMLLASADTDESNNFTSTLYTLTCILPSSGAGSDFRRLRIERGRNSGLPIAST